MDWKTTNLSALKYSPVWPTLPEASRASIAEGLPALSVWRNPHSLIPSGTRYDSAANAIVFPEPVELSRIASVHNATTGEWMWLPNSGHAYAGVLSTDGRTLTLNSTHPKSKDTDVLSGGYTSDVLASDSAASAGWTDVPADWLRPLLLVDLRQINDAKTYDGALPACIVEARNVRPTLPEYMVWTTLPDLIGGLAQGAGDTAALATANTRITQLEAQIEQVRKAVA